MKIKEVPLGASIVARIKGQKTAEGVFVQHDRGVGGHGSIVCMPADAVTVPEDGGKTSSGQTWTSQCWDGADVEIVSEPPEGSHVVLMPGTGKGNPTLIRIAATADIAQAEIDELAPDWKALAFRRPYRPSR